MFKDTGNGHTNFCLNCELLQRKFNDYKDAKEIEIAKYKQCLCEIEQICKKSWHDSGITIDYFKRNNYSWKQQQIRSLICRFEQIIQKIKEARGE